jgi:hypothetical protein
VRAFWRESEVGSRARSGSSGARIRGASALRDRLDKDEVAATKQRLSADFC